MLRPWGFCNLSQAVSRPGDTEEDLARKVRLATIIGTIQSLSTRFPGLRDEWKKNAEEERLLGVDLTAQHDCELLRPGAEGGDELRKRLVRYSVEVNEEFAELLGIEPSAAISCNKPAGNSAEVLNSANGIHARQAEFYARRYTIGAHTPIFKTLKQVGAPMEPQVGSDPESATKWILTIPKRSPAGVTFKKDMSAVDQCEFWLLNKENWTEHNPSCTITYREDEVVDLIAWVVRNKEKIGGLSFFPVADAIYAQAPFEEITEEEYNELLAEFPDIDYSQIYVHELEDMTTAAQELACFAGSCEV
jgi:ribonucleoside-triphosphate reductase